MHKIRHVPKNSNIESGLFYSYNCPCPNKHSNMISFGAGVVFYMTWHNKSIKEIYDALAVNPKNGLSTKEVEKRLCKYGRNRLEGKKKRGITERFISQFKDFMIIILLAAAAISFVTSVMAGEADFIDPIIILVIVVFNAIIGVVQESRAERSIEALKKMTPQSSTVRRNGMIQEVSAEELVPGDIVIIKTGMRVSADCRIIECVDFFVDESMLTGESEPVHKKAEASLNEHTLLAERKNMIWSGSMAVGGKCEAVVCSTGMSTEMGNIASLIITAEKRETPLQQKLEGISKILGSAALVICAVIFVIGISIGIEPLEMFITSVSLAVAAIPEGLPAIVTVMLAIGVQKMAKNGAIVRNLPSVETLGSASVICSDKTGTLTENRMTVVRTYTDDKKMLLKLGAICSDADSQNPTETAILNAAEKEGILEIDRRYKRVGEIPFNSDRKMMSVTADDGRGVLSVTKGAPDVVLKLCTHKYENGAKVPIKNKNELIRQNEKMANDALRVIAVAYKNVSGRKPEESGLVFVGLIGIEDPPRQEAKEAVEICKKAGITPVMITGDHMVTAKAIAKKIGIGGEQTMTGEMLGKITQEELEKDIEKYSVFARVTPAHKMRIVRAWQKKGAVVAMTGDGVNDAPALKAADIGCSMGISGTDVAKNASDMILTDDNFATIVKAVREGRGIYANIRKAVKFLLSSNIGEILTVFLGLLFGNRTILPAIQLLWVNLVTDSLPAIALGLDPTDKYIMEESPKPRNKGIFSDGMWLSIILEGAIIGSLALIAFSIGKLKADISVARTMAFSVLSMSQLVHAFNMRSERSIFSVGFLSNKYLVGAFFAGVFLQCGVVSVAPVSRLFKVVPLNLSEWITVAILSLMPLIIIEIQKLFTKKTNGSD